MLTIKHVEEDGFEGVRQCKSMSFFPPGHSGGSKDKCVVMLHETEGGDPDGIVQFASGTVYAMNSEGATVARYDLNKGG